MEDRVASFAIMAVARRRVSAEQWFSGGHASLFITIIRSYVLGMCDVRCVDCRYTGYSREIMMGGGNGVASVIMLTFPSEPCPHAHFSK